VTGVMPKKALRLTKRKPVRKLGPAAIDKARGQAMLAIERRRAATGDNVFLDKASRLLTRHWSKADWTARAALLKSADWLIRVAARPAAGDAAAQDPVEAAGER